MGGGKGGSKTQKIKVKLPGFQEDALKFIAQQGQNLVQSRDPTFFPGQTVAGFSPLEQEAQQGAADFARGGLQDLAGQAAGAQQFLLGDVLSPFSNPAIQQAAQGAIRPVFQQLQENVLPGIRSGFVASGQLGSPRQGIAEGLAIDRATQSALDTTSDIFSQAYGQGLDAFTKGLALTPQTAQLGLQPSAVLGGVGAQQRALDQALIDEAVARHEFEQAAPFAELGALQQLVQGSAGGTSAQQLPSQGLGQQVAGGIGAGLSGFGAAQALGLGAAAPFIGGGLGLLSLFG